jgi:hypothetical protein
MKIQAKEVQVGMTVIWGVVSITVEKIVPFTQKNGKTGKTFYGSAVRSMGRGRKPSFSANYYINVRDES